MKKNIIYRFLTGPDDATFCRRVTEALQDGWQLYGDPQLSVGADGIARCGQAVIKETNESYDSERPLSSY